MASGEGADLVYDSMPNLVQLFIQMIQPSVDEPTTINVSKFDELSQLVLWAESDLPLIRQALKAFNNFLTYRKFDLLVEPALLRSLRDALMHSSVSVRHNAVNCIWNIARNPAAHRELRETEIDAALRGFIYGRLSSGGGSIPAPTSMSALGSSHLLSLTIPPPSDNESKEAKQKAREALRMIEPPLR